MLCTTHINRGDLDSRRMDIITSGFSGVMRGTPLFMDATIISPLRGNGTPVPNAVGKDGAALDYAGKKNRETDYPDVENSPDATLLCLGAEVFGRWHPHCIKLVRQLAKLKSESYSPELQSATRSCYANRWWSLLSVGVQKIINTSLVRITGHDLRNNGDAWHPPVGDVLDFFRTTNEITLTPAVAD